LRDKEHDRIDKSIQRAKKSSVTVLELLAEEGASVIPGGGLASNLVKRLVSSRCGKLNEAFLDAAGR